MAVVSSHRQRLSGVIPRHCGGRIHRLRRCHNHARQAGRHGPPSLRPPVVHLYWRSGRHVRGRHRGWDVHAHGHITFMLNIKAGAQKSTRSEDYGTLPSQREGAQQYRSTGLPIYGIGRSCETFGWVLPVTMGWAETSGCATLCGCSMVHRGKSIVNGSKNTQFPCAMCVRHARTVHKSPCGVDTSGWGHRAFWRMQICGWTCGASCSCWRTVSPFNRCRRMLGWKAMKKLANRQPKGEP